MDALIGVDLHLAPGEWVAITGRSGSGKSTMLNLEAVSTSRRPAAWPSTALISAIAPSLAKRRA